MGKIVSCLNETRKMKNGLKATCIVYRKWDDIDIQFEDGVVVQHRAKKSFYNGEIKHPDINTMTVKASCLGETRTMKNGQKATCIDFIDSKHITIQFEDKTIVKNKSKREFYLGTIGNPKIGTRITSHRSILGQTKLMNCGLNATVIADRSARDIDVEFEDGTKVEHRGRADFIRQEISHPFFALRSFPQQFVLYCVRHYFSDAIADYRPSFLKSKTSNKNLEIDIWIPSIKVAIEYDGYPWHKNETKQSLEKYELLKNCPEISKVMTFVEKGCVVHTSNKHTNFLLNYESNSSARNDDNFYIDLSNKVVEMLLTLGVKKVDLIFDEKMFDEVRKSFSLNENVGQENTMKNGQKAKIVLYRNVADIDIQFEDGTIVKHRRMQNFLSGEIKNPKYDPSNIVGVKAKMLNGLYATCIAYRDSKDIDIQFEDGVIVEHKAKNNFLRGRVAHPHKNPYDQLKKSIVGEEHLMNCGLKAKCIKYRKYSDIDVQFEDGTIVTNKTVGAFRQGKIGRG